MSRLTGHVRANQSPWYHYTFFSEIIHNADASNTHRGPGYKYGCAQRTVRHFPKIKRKTQLSKNRGNPAYTLNYSLHLALHSIFSIQMTMLAMGGFNLKHVVVAALCSVLVTLTLGSPVVGPEPIRCAPCTPEKQNQCPAVAPGCAEVLREPGCGCCLACALKAGELCGIYTAPCGSGLRCTPRPGDPRPLHSLTRGQALCTESTEPEPTPEPQTQDQGEPEAEMENTAIISDPGSSHYLPGLSKPFDPRAAADAQESMKAKLIAIRKKLVEQGPCHLELQTALEKIAKSQQKLGDKLTRFYLPNCDKHGLYKPKQCESSLDGQRGRCWCVNSWNGKKILGSTDLPADAECP